MRQSQAENAMVASNSCNGREKEQPGGNEHRRVCLYENSISLWYIMTQDIEVPSRCVLVHSIASSTLTPAGRSRRRAQWPGSIARSQGRCGWEAGSQTLQRSWDGGQSETQIVSRLLKYR